jgi:hypothetical protein
MIKENGWWKYNNDLNEKMLGLRVGVSTSFISILFGKTDMFAFIVHIGCLCESCMQFGFTAYSRTRHHFSQALLLAALRIVTVVLHGTILSGIFYGVCHADRCCKEHAAPSLTQTICSGQETIQVGAFEVLVHVGLFHMVQFILTSSLGCLAAGRHTFASDLVLVLTDWNSTGSFYRCSTGG